MIRWPRALLAWKLRRRRRGTLYSLGRIASPQLGNTREIQVYLPPGHGKGNRRYPVIYMQDGQNLFDPRLSFAGDWGLLEGLAEAGREGAEAIVVAVPNMGEERIDEYSPFEDPKAGGGRADQYLDFLLETVKPGVDRLFSTQPGREHTGIAGSSMGGLLSLYGFFSRPGAFGFTAALSPSLWFADRAIFPVVEAAPFTPGRIYLDTGTEEGVSTLENARRMRDLLGTLGYTTGRDLHYVEDQGAGHTEAAWGRRFRVALPFLLSARPGA